MDKFCWLQIVRELRQACLDSPTLRDILFWTQVYLINIDRVCKFKNYVNF